MPGSGYVTISSDRAEITLKREVKPNPPGDSTLDEHLGKNISDFCTNGYDSNDVNHCAHFVSHVKGYAFPRTVTCAKMRYETRNSVGASLRVNEVFDKCPEVGIWSNKPESVDACLAFVTLATNVSLENKTMTDHPRKHIGIYSGGMIYHYSNRMKKVVKQSPDVFARHYKGNNVQVYYGTFPT